MKILVFTTLAVLCISTSAHAMGGDSAPIMIKGANAQIIVQEMKQAGFIADADGTFSREVVSCSQRHPGDEGYTGNPQADSWCEFYEKGN